MTDEGGELMGAREWDPNRCACRWGEQPCDRCLPVLDARFRERQMQKTTDTKGEPR